MRMCFEGNVALERTLKRNVESYAFKARFLLPTLALIINNSVLHQGWETGYTELC